MTMQSEDVSTFRDLLAQGSVDKTNVFSEPWEARAFALVLSLSERGLFTLAEFQEALIARIGEFEKAGCVVSDTDYYTRWIEALEDLLAKSGMLKAERIAHLEGDVVADAESRKVHQRAKARDEHGRLRIAPLVIDPGKAAH